MDCPGCGFSAEPSTGPTHAYIGASSACWSRYGEFLAGGDVPQTAVDAYAVQHPGVDERRARQSVAVHLISLCATLEQPMLPLQGVALLRVALERPDGYPWLPLATPIGTTTLDDVLRREASVTAWVNDVWDAWSLHHLTVRTWLRDCVERG